MAFAMIKDERRADDYDHELRNGQIPDCSKTPGRKRSSITKMVAVAAPDRTPQ